MLTLRKAGSDRASASVAAASVLDLAVQRPATAGDATVVHYPVGIAVSDAGAVYLGSRDGGHVYRFDGAGSWVAA